MTSTIVGAKRPEQVDENVGAEGTQLDEAECVSIDAIVHEELGSSAEESR